MDNTTTIQTEQQQETESMLSLRDILDIFVYNWKWFVVSAIICVALGRLYLATQPKIYQRQSVMLVKESNSGGRRATGNEALMQLNGVMMGTSVENEMYILQSHQLMKEVVRKLNLDINYGYHNNLKTLNLYDVKPFNGDVLRAYVMGAVPKANGRQTVAKGGTHLIDILRDPPGANSYAYIESGSKYSYSYSWNMNGGLGLTMGYESGTGTNIYQGAWAGNLIGTQAGTFTQATTSTKWTLSSAKHQTPQRKYLPYSVHASDRTSSVHAST